jgi:hypothetical protein
MDTLSPMEIEMGLKGVGETLEARVSSRKSRRRFAPY